jgi:glycosyltransferase involved in cell wall biosynthesis
MHTENTGDERSGVVSDNGTVTGSKGGTEMMMEGLMQRLPSHLKEEYNIICSRVRKIDENKKNILWLHDTWNDPETQHLQDPESRKKFEKFIFVSNYQFQTFNMGHGITYHDSFVIPNAIVPIPAHTKPDDGQIRLIYHTTPHRGLNILIAAYERLYEKWGDKIVLDVYSSFNIYGWPQRDEPFETLFDKCRAHPGINYHGTVSNDEVREALTKSHIFAYPSIWPETSCISLIEAMSAGCLVVHSDLAALTETSSSFGVCYRFDEDINTHANKFIRVLDMVLENYNAKSKQIQEGLLRTQKSMTDVKHNWDMIVPQWTDILNNLSQEQK